MACIWASHSPLRYNVPRVILCGLAMALAQAYQLAGVNPMMNRRSFLQLAALCCLGQAGCRRGPSSPDAVPGMPPVVVVVLDTVRASHCSGWGYARSTTPHLDRLASAATRYARAIAPAPWTLPSHASLFTGLYPFEHDCRTHLLTSETGARSVFEPPLEDAQITLAEVLKSAGYTTAAFVANTVFLSARYNVLQGFSTAVVDRMPGLDLAGQGLAWLEAHKGQPFFAFFNLMDAHRPYNLSTEAVSPDWEVPTSPDLLDALYNAVMPGVGEIPVNLAGEVTRQYDLGIRNADEALGRVLAWLEQAGLYEEAIVVVASDHGEFLGEHHLVEHSKDIYQPTAWVPLVVKMPGQRSGRVVNDWTSLCAVPGMVLESVQGGALVAQGGFNAGLAAARPTLCENYYSRAWDYDHPVWGKRFRRRRTALFEGEYKLIHSSDGQHELYDLEADPGEKTNLFSELGAISARLMERLVAFKPLDETDQRPLAPAESAPFTEEEIEQMEALGYLGPDSGSAGNTGALSPAPRP